MALRGGCLILVVVIAGSLQLSPKQTLRGRKRLFVLLMHGPSRKSQKQKRESKGGLR